MVIRGFKSEPSGERVVQAALALYREGWFPMCEEEGVEWVRPHRRAVIPLDERFRVGRSLRSRVGSGRFVIRSDRAFSEVIRACAAKTAGRRETWLSEEIVGLFEMFHGAGFAHSVEAYLRGATGEEVLVGGLYGLAVGSVFCGESMFSRPELGGTDASKVCLVHLVEHLRARGFTMLDSQITNPHLVQFGAYEISDRAYRAHLRAHGEDGVTWSPWTERR